MPKREDVKKVLVIGSGPIVIGQAAEFDYAGTQACRALQARRGMEVVLINSNPATIMTDKTMADKIYIEPLDADVVKKIIEIEKPDSILPTLGGQTGLNLAMELAEEGFLEQHGREASRAPTSESIKKAEDRAGVQGHDGSHRRAVHCFEGRRAPYEDALDVCQGNRLSRSSSVPHTRWAARAAASRMTRRD